MRSLGLTAAIFCLLALVILALFAGPRSKKWSSRASHWLWFVVLFLLPIIAMTGTLSSVMEETTAVSSCGSCHVMQPFVSDMQNAESRTLAARHYQHRWIPRNQCYTCHSTYGLHGTLAAKSAALRHWWLYVTASWREPIRHQGLYPNANCLACHAEARRFVSGASHRALATDLASNRASCIQCHGSPHPSPAERQDREPR
jgi:cytochrome c nitrite reductase small subunit